MVKLNNNKKKIGKKIWLENTEKKGDPKEEPFLLKTVKNKDLNSRTVFFTDDSNCKFNETIEYINEIEI